MRGLAAAAMLAAVAACAAVPVATVTPTIEPGAPGLTSTAVPATEGTGLRAIRVEGIDQATGTVDFADVAVFFDQEADKAAREDGNPGAPNPVWIRELGTSGSLVLDPDASVTLLGYDAEGNRVPRRADAATFVRVYGGGAPAGECEGAPWLFVRVDDGRITSIEAIETP